MGEQTLEHRPSANQLIVSFALSASLIFQFASVGLCRPECRNVCGAGETCTWRRLPKALRRALVHLERSASACIREFDFAALEVELTSSWSGLEADTTLSSQSPAALTLRLKGRLVCRASCLYRDWETVRGGEPIWVRRYTRCRDCRDAVRSNPDDRLLQDKTPSTALPG